MAGDFTLIGKHRRQGTLQSLKLFKAPKGEMAAKIKEKAEAERKRKAAKASKKPLPSPLDSQMIGSVSVTHL
jgi:hypothetical protein